MSKVSYQITDLSNKWYQYVSLDHHKDRDCHWYIEVDYAYGERPKYRAIHHGYVAASVSGPVRQSLAEAEEDLLALLLKSIRNQLQWARGVLRNPDYEEADVARKAIEIFQGVDES